MGMNKDYVNGCAKNKKVRTTVYLDPKLIRLFELYKTQEPDVDSFSQYVNDMVKNNLEDPFVWNNRDMYNFAMSTIDVDKEDLPNE